jgi:hypothetical protein
VSVYGRFGKRGEGLPDALGRRLEAVPWAAMGDEPRRVFDELAKIRVVDVVLPTRSGVEIRRRCITRPTDHQAILLQHLSPRVADVPAGDGRKRGRLVVKTHGPGGVKNAVLPPQLRKLG